jgi:hypothetical protein
MPTKYMILGFGDHVLCDDSLRLVRHSATMQSLHLDIRFNYYRGLHISNIIEFGLKLDGQTVPSSNIIFKLRDKEFAISELADQYTEFWGVKDRATLECFIGPVAEGEHDVELTLRLRSPYMQFAPGVYAIIDSSGHKKMTLRTVERK